MKQNEKVKKDQLSTTKITDKFLFLLFLYTALTAKCTIFVLFTD